MKTNGICAESSRASATRQGTALMPVALYMDVHVPQAVTEQLLRRNVDVLTAIEDDAAELATKPCEESS